MMNCSKIKKMNTKNLLRYYRAERQRMFLKGYRYGIVDESELGEPVQGWDNLSGSETFSQDISHLEEIKRELDNRENV